MALAARKWYEELLGKYPQMKPQYRDVPDEQNGFLQFLLLKENLKEPKLPEDLVEMRTGDSPWDSGKLKAWLTANKDYLDQILHVAELPDQSTKGVDFSRLAQGKGRLGSEFGFLLTASARIAFEEGDREAALRYGKAAIGLSNHLTGIEVPSMLGMVMAEGIRVSARESFLENILPGLSGDPQALASWREALFPKKSPSGEVARVLSGEWNVLMLDHLLPAQLGAPMDDPGGISARIPDSGTFLDCYTAATEKLAASLQSSGLDRFNTSQCDLVFPESGVDPGTLQRLKEAGSLYRGLVTALGVNSTNAAMMSAAVAVHLGEDPGIDPVSGKPFQWDPVSRTLSLPEGAVGNDPIKLP